MLWWLMLGLNSVVVGLMSTRIMFWVVIRFNVYGYWYLGLVLF